MGASAAVYDEGLCPRRLLPYRGVDGAGNPISAPAMPFLPAVLVQAVEDGEAVARWSAAPANQAPEDMIRVGTDAHAADLANYIPFLVGKTADGAERMEVGSDDEASGQWKMVWIASLQQWTTVPDDAFTDLCTLLASDLILDPGNVGGYLVRVDSTSTMTVGVSLKIGGYEMVVTEVVDEEYVRVESVSPPASPATLEAGTSACNIGFRPCPRSEEPYADTPVFCLGDVPVSLTTPADISGMKVPGTWWRDQLGQVGFLAAPVDPVTGIVVANYYLATPASPLDAVANIPGFRSLPRWHFHSPVQIFSQVTGTVPVNATSTVVLSSTSGWVPGATAVLITVSISTTTTTTDFRCSVLINGVVRGFVLVVANSSTSVNSAQCLIEVPADTEVTIEVQVFIGAAGVANGSDIKVYTDGFFAP